MGGGISSAGVDNDALFEFEASLTPESDFCNTESQVGKTNLHLFY